MAFNFFLFLPLLLCLLNNSYLYVFYPLGTTQARGILLTLLSVFCAASKDALGSATSATAVHFLAIKHCRKGSYFIGIEKCPR